MLKNKKILGILVILSIFVSLFAVNYFMPVSVKVKIIENNPLVRQFLHSWRSLKKLPDIFFAYYWLTPKKLPVYELSINMDDLIEMNEALPDDIVSGQLNEENKIFKSAIFSSGDYRQKVKVRYRGRDSNHWDGLKKSLMVKFPKKNYFNGVSIMSFTIPYDRLYFIEPLNAYRASKFGLLTPQFSFVNLKINGFDYGVYLAYEHWTSEWLERNSYPGGMNIFTLNDVLLKKDPISEEKTTFSLGAEKYWESYTNKQIENFDEIKALIAILNEEDDSEFIKNIADIVDLEKFYRWDVINILSNSIHQTDFANLIFIFNNATGKFEFIPWDVALGQVNGDSYYPATTIARRIFSIPQFRERRDSFLKEYVNDENNLKDDLGFFDRLAEKTKKDFFSDNAKRYNNFQFRAQIKKYRQYAADNFKNALMTAENADYGAKIELSGQADFPEEFSRFREINISISDFTRKHPQFLKIGENEAVLLPGSHVFLSTVVAPKGMKIVIYPGASIYMGDRVSFISYSPIVAKGSKFNPISVNPLYSGPDRQWGVFAIVNTGDEESVFDWFNISGGKDASLNGINFTGMLSLHNSNAVISNSSFSNAYGDDALNIKLGKADVSESLFKGNSSDAIDIDVSKGSVLRKNIFIENSGDAIDLSWSDSIIKENIINGCGDKGVSVGEKSFPLVEGNEIKNCDIGIAVKDLSSAKISGNEIIKNNTGISLYKKKEIFGGGSAVLIGNSLIDNVVKIYKDVFSDFIIND